MKCLCDAHEAKSHRWSLFNHHLTLEKTPHLVQTENTFSIQIVNDHVVQHTAKTSSHIIPIKKENKDKQVHKKAKDQLPPKLLERQRRQRIYWRFFMTTFYLAFSLLLLHGAVAKSPSNLLPYFCLQVFDFVITLLWVIGHLANVNSSRILIEEMKCIPWTRSVATHNPTILAFLVVSLCLLILSMEVYLMGVVWACYKYLVTMRLANGAAGLDLGANLLSSFFARYNLRNGGGRNERPSPPRGTGDAALENGRSPDDAQIDELPQYDETIKTPANKFMPPPYLGMDTDKKTKPDEKSGDGSNA